MENDDVFREDDQAPFLSVLMSNPYVRKIMIDEKSKDKGPLMSDSFVMIDLGNGTLRHATQKEIMFGRMERYDAMKRKFVYPNVKIDLYLYSEVKVLNMGTDIRLKYRWQILSYQGF